MTTYFRLAVLILALGLMALTSSQVSGSSEAKQDGGTHPSAKQTIASKLVTTAVTFTVNSTGDTSDVMPADGLCDDGAGNCTLRAAIEEANALAGTDTINFNISPSGPQTISPAMSLPAITDTVIINGTTQPGFSGTPIIEVKGATIEVTASGCTIRGLLINSIDGIAIRLTGSSNLVAGNYIGTDLTGTMDGGGVGSSAIFIDGNGNTIGGTGVGDANILGFNGRGVTVNTGIGNSIRANSIFSNIGLGIDLNNDSVTANDLCDADIGTNGLQNYPTLTAAQANGSFVAIQGGLESVASSSYEVDFYANSACDSSGFGEGQTFIGSTVVTTDASCKVLFSVTFPSTVAVGQFITATATDAFGDTSEFSQCVTVAGGSFSDLQITKSDSPDPVVTGSNITYTITVTNNGPDTEIGASFSDTVPAGTTFVSLTSSGSCSTPPVGGTGTVSCSLGAIAAGASETITLVVNVTAAPGSTISNTASVSGMSSDPTTANNSATANTTVTGAPVSDLQITNSDSPDPVVTGSNITYTITVTNNGPSAEAAATFGTTVPVGTTFVSLTSPGTCTAPPVGGTGTISCSLGALAAGVPTTITLVVNVTAAPGSTISNTASVSGTSSDPTLGNNSVTANTTVSGGPVSDLQITKSDSPDPVLTGSNITYTITVTNNGPDAEIGASFSDTLPAGTTFVSVTSPGSCSTPSVGGTGTVSCSLGALATGASATITLVVNVTAAPGSTIMNTASISGMSSDPTLGNNSATANTTVSGGCTITCPGSLTRNTDPNQCGAVVTYTPPDTSGPCGTVTCSPPSGTFFPKGTTNVTCSTVSNTSCSFGITVVDNTPPRITCPADIVAPTDPGKAVAVVDYAFPAFSDNCPDATAVCLPPSGTVFPLGVSTVTCSAKDVAGNTAFCTINITVADTETPLISCPANITVVPPAGQTSAVVSYASPTVSDNLPGATVACLPVSGSSFPPGITTVTCTATDVRSNKASCSFTVTVGGPQAGVTLPGNKAAIELATVRPARKPPKPRKNPCTLFTIQNIGFAPLVLTFDSIRRTGADVTSGRITDPNDVNAVAEIAPMKFFTLSLLNSDESLTPLNIGAMLTLQPGQTQTFCLKFFPLIPGLAGKTTGLAASDVLPDIVTSTVSFRQNAGANIAIPVRASVATGVVLIDPANPRRTPVVSFTRSGDEITVSYAVFDSNLDVSRAKYEFLDANGQVVAGPFEIDLTEPLRSLNLVRGQSFIVEQRFTGASDSPEITGVRVTVFDGETSIVGSSSATSATPTRTSSIQLRKAARGVTLYPSDLKIGPLFP